MLEIDALTLRGAQLLTGRGAAFALDEGIRALMRASELGGAEAAARLATLAGMGAGLPQNWTRALEFLTLAADRGFEPARGQLRVLAGEPTAAKGWGDLARRIDIAVWTAAAAKRPICEAPRIRMLEGFVSPTICDWLIGIGAGRVTPAMVYDRETGGMVADAARTNTAFELGIGDVDFVTVLVRARIAGAAGVPVGALEPPQLLHYEPGQRFAQHYDFLDVSEPGYARDVAERGQRIVTFLIYLNRGYEGGATTFPKVGLDVCGEPGDGVMFANVDRLGAPDPMTLHAGAPPTAGEKWILSQWIRDRAFGTAA